MSHASGAPSAWDSNSWAGRNLTPLTHSGHSVTNTHIHNAIPPCRTLCCRLPFFLFPDVTSCSPLSWRASFYAWCPGVDPLFTVQSQWSSILTCHSQQHASLTIYPGHDTRVSTCSEILSYSLPPLGHLPVLSLPHHRDPEIFYPPRCHCPLLLCSKSNRLSWLYLRHLSATHASLLWALSDKLRLTFHAPHVFFTCNAQLISLMMFWLDDTIYSFYTRHQQKFPKN